MAEVTAADISNRVTTTELDGIFASYWPFADSDYIDAQLAQHYKSRLLEFSDAFPVAGEIADALDRADPYISNRVLGDTTVRGIIQKLSRRGVTGADPALYSALVEVCREVLDATARFLSGAEGPAPLSLTRDQRLGADQNYPWIWDNDRPEGDVFGETFKLLVRQYYGELHAPSADEVAMLRRGAKLLDELVPLSSRSTLRHTHIVAVVPDTGPWKRLKSSSQYLLGGAIFLSNRLLDNPWLIAEQLYHESLHQKLYDLRRTHTVLAQDSSPNPTVPSKVRSLWNYPNNEWDSHQALAAFHVYVHMTLLCTVAEQRSGELEETYGPKKAMTASRVAFERAHYLGEGLRDSCWGDLGRAGQLLVEWLISVLGAFDPSPPPPGSYVHLLLNRYLREAERVRTSSKTPEVWHQARLLADDEAAVTAGLLDRMNENVAAEQLRAALEAIPAQDPISRFGEVRHIIASTLRDRCPDGYSLRNGRPTEHDPNKVVASMVERSSRLLVTAQQIDELDGPSIQDVLTTSFVENQQAASGTARR
jgi:hypothetical protein